MQSEGTEKGKWLCHLSFKSCLVPSCKKCKKKNYWDTKAEVVELLKICDGSCFEYMFVVLHNCNEYPEANW